MLIDSHCHLDRLDLTKYDGSLSAALASAKTAGVEHFLCVSIDLESYPAMLAAAEEFDSVSVSVGVHPSHTGGSEPTAADLAELAANPKVVAIGETGLDYHYNEGDLDWQRNRFRTHIQAAHLCAKPLIIHTRAAREDTLTILREEHAEQVGGVMHCFTEDWAMAEQAIDLNFYISFSGIVTFKSAEALQEVARRVPMERMLVETDSPYLAPVPYRGKPNEPAWVTHVAEHIAQLRGCDVDTLARATSANFRRLFACA